MELRGQDTEGHILVQTDGVVLLGVAEDVAIVEHTHPVDVDRLLVLALGIGLGRGQAVVGEVLVDGDGADVEILAQLGQDDYRSAAGEGAYWYHQQRRRREGPGRCSLTRSSPCCRDHN